MSSYGWQTPNPFLDNDPNNNSFSSQFQTFKPLPLPDDIFGFDNPLKPSSIEDLDLSKLNANISNGNFDQANFDDILFDLGISEPPLQTSKSSSESVDPIKLTAGEPPRGHKRKISGSGIFGFIGTGNDTQLAIPGLAPLPVVFSDKKPIYLDIENQLQQMDYKTSRQSSIKLEDLATNTGDDKPEYIVSNSSFKFPASRDTSIQHNESQLRTPVKTVQSVDDLSKELSNFAHKSEAKPIQFVSPSKSPLRNVFTSSPLKPKALNMMDNQANDNDTDKTISEFSTPLKVKPAFANISTPSPNKTPTKISWFPTLITKKNNITEKMLKEQKASPIRKKKPTITSTLATGTLDKFFIGPVDEDKKYICKFTNQQAGTICNREFNRISNVRAHVQTHLCDRPFVCEICQKAFVRNHDLRRHAKVHEDFKFVCPCGKKFPRHDAMKRHRIRNICKGGFANGESESESPKETTTEHVIINPAKRKKVANSQKSSISKLSDSQKTSQHIDSTKKQQLELHQKRLMELQEEQKRLESQIQQEQQQLQYETISTELIETHETVETFPSNDETEQKHQLKQQQALEVFDMYPNFHLSFDNQNLPI